MNASTQTAPMSDPESDGRRPFEVDDLYLQRKPTALHCVPGLEVAACVVRSIDREQDGYVSRIWRFALDGSGGVQVTQGAGRSDTSPRWSDDGSQLAFVSDRGGGPPQLFVMQRQGGGEARQVGRFAQSVASPRWHPDGQRLFVAAALLVDPDCGGRRGNTAPSPRPAHAPEVVWRLPYKEDGIGLSLIHI